MGKVEKSFYWLFLVFVIYITIGFKIIPAVLKDQLVKNLDENLTQKTTIEKIEFNPFIFKLTLHGFKLADSSDTASIKFKEFYIDFDLLKSIEKLTISFKAIALKDATINIIEDDDSRLNLTKLLKPQEKEEEIKEEDENSEIIDFIVSKLELINANISYTKPKDNYSLNLDNINYTLYDLGTHKNILSSNDLKFNLNKHTKVSIGGAFNLVPFKVYGKVSIEDLRLTDFLTYKKDLLNFKLDDKANLNLDLNYNLDTTEELALFLNSDKFEFNNINLSQKKIDILNLEKLEIKKFDFDLEKQKINLDNILFKALKTNMILDKDGINLANLLKEEKEINEVEEVVEAKEDKNTEKSKPWRVDLKNLNLNKADFIFNDITNNTVAKSNAFNIELASLKIVDSDIDLNKLIFSNPNLSFNDNKNSLSIQGEDTLIKLDNLSLKKDIININKIDFSNNSLSINDKKSNIAIKSNKIALILDSLNIADNKTSLNSINLKTTNLIFDEIKSKLNIKASNIDINLNSLLVNNGKTSIDSIALKTPKLDFNHKLSKMNIDSSNIDLNLNKIAINDLKTAIDSIDLKTSNLDFEDLKSKINVNTSNIDLALNKFILNDSDISLNNIKLLKPSINFADNTNNIKIDSNNIEIYVNNLSKIKDKIAIDSIKLFEPNLDFLDTSSKTKIKAQNLDLIINKLSNSNSGFKIQNIDLNKPNIEITLAKTTQTKATKEEDLKKVEKTKAAKKEDQSKASSSIFIGPVNINNAILSFEDENLPLAFKTTVSKLNGKISEFQNSKPGETTLEVNGIVDKYGVAKITGIVDPNNIKLLTDINMIFSNINISNFTPYSGKFVGREIKSGKLDLDLKYNIKKSNLNAKNNITISKIELGKNIQSPDAVSLPLDIAITLLKKPNGIIDIKLPVSGNIDDPQFSIGSIVWNAFVNLMTKAVTAPFSLLGSLFNFDENEIKSVNFKLTEDEITPIQEETLDKIAIILNAKPDLAIKVNPSHNNQKELNALKEKKYLSKNPEHKDLKKEELQKLYKEEKIDENTLDDIAKNRIKNIKDYLVNKKDISSKQIILSDEIRTSNSSISLDIKKIK